MGELFFKNIICKERRPCYVHDKRAMFHNWSQESQICPPSLMVGGHSGGVISGTMAIVEYENGTVERVSPESVKFVDGKNFEDKFFYVKVPENHIVIDFDIPDDNGQKSYEQNIEEASKWPPTYAELSKSKKGIHLHYIYTGDPSQEETNE